MGSSKKPEQQVADYMMSIHFGVAHEVDSIERVKINDKVAFEGRQSSNTTLSINLPNLFGGAKKEGGARGLIEVLMGAADQLLPTRLALKLGGTPDSIPAFRGITSLFFTGGGTQASEGFYWTSNSPYLRPVDVTVRRSPKGFYPAKALIPEGLDMAATSEVLARHTATYYPPGAYTIPRVAFISPDRVDFHLAQWTSAFPTLPANWSKYEFAKSGFVGEFMVPEYGPVSPGGPPGPGTSDNPNAFWAAASDISGSDTYPGDSTNIPVCERGGVCAGLSAGRLFVKLPPSAAPGSTPVNVSAEGAQALAVGPDGKIYTLWHDSSLASVTVRVYQGAALDLVKTITLSGFISGVDRYLISAETDTLYIIRNGNHSYPGASGSYVGLWTIDLLTWTVSGPSLLPPTLSSTLDNINIDFRVFGDVVVRGYSDYSSHTLWAEWIRIIPPKYTREDANPAHIIFECLTNTDWGLGLPVSQIDVASFTAAADTLYAEGLGLSMLWSNPSDLESFINDILGHIDGSYGIDPATGKIYLSLVRGGYSTSGLFELTPDNCKVTRFQRKSLSETVNEVVVTWTNPENEQEETVTVHDLANYSMQGVLNSASSNYYGVRNGTLATRLALRDLTRGAAPLASVEVDADRAAWKKKPGEVVLLTYPEYGLVQLPLRVMSVNYGRPGASKVQLSLVEDVFDTPDSAYVEVSGSLDDNAVAPPTALEFVQGGSAPYYLVSQELGSSEASATNADEAYSMILASSATQLSNIDMQVATTNALGTTEYMGDGSLIVSGRATLSAGLALEVTSSLAFSGFSGNVPPSVGGLVWIGSGDPKLSELALISTIGATLSVFRGVLDTTPKVWPAGTQVWFITPGLDAYDDTARLNGQTVSYKLIPSNPGGTLNPAWAPVTTVTIDNRQHLPYRPANVKLNGVAWPSAAAGPVVVSWSRRNRLLEDPVIRQWPDADVTPEAGQTVTATLRRVDTNAVLAETTGIAGTNVSLDSTYGGEVTLTLTSVRDGLSSYQPFVHQFTLATLRKTEAGETRVSESGETRILEN